MVYIQHVTTVYMDLVWRWYGEGMDVLFSICTAISLAAQKVIPHN